MENNNHYKIGICVPTVREDQIRLFLKTWIKIWEKSPYDITIYIHADNPRKIINTRELDTILSIVHTCHKDVKKEFGDDQWVIPKKSGACRSFPMFLAYKDKCDFIFAMDDDCLPLEKYSDNFLDTHINAFNKNKWYSTIEGELPRGVPYTNLGKINICLNHGLWKNFPDLDGPTSLVNIRYPRDIYLKEKTEIIPSGIFFPLCVMNVCYSYNIIPASYNLLMGLEKYGLDRFDDIWSGIFIKKIADHLGLFITNGAPYINHAKASNFFVNTKKEIEGIQINEELWEYVDNIKFNKSDDTISGCYKQLAKKIKIFKPSFKTTSVQPDYFSELSRAMMIWIEKINQVT